MKTFKIYLLAMTLLVSALCFAACGNTNNDEMPQQQRMLQQETVQIQVLLTIPQIMEMQIITEQKMTVW